MSVTSRHSAVKPASSLRPALRRSSGGSAHSCRGVKFSRENAPTSGFADPISAVTPHGMCYAGTYLSLIRKLSVTVIFCQCFTKSRFKRVCVQIELAELHTYRPRVRPTVKCSSGPIGLDHGWQVAIPLCFQEFYSGSYSRSLFLSSHRSMQTVQERIHGVQFTSKFWYRSCLSRSLFVFSGLVS